MRSGAPKSTVIVTPVYRSKLTEIEHSLLTRTGTASEHPRVFVIPDGLDIGEIRERHPQAHVKAISAENLTSVRHYNFWLTSPDFYSMWPDFEWILISQLDAVLVSDPWEVLADGDPSWDVLGAPWNPPVRVVTTGNRILVRSPSGQDRGPGWVGVVGRQLQVGNGGLSLRRRAAFQAAATALESKTSRATRQHTNEDVLWAAFGPRHGVASAEPKLAAEIFWETIDPGNLRPEQVPLATGYHGVDRWPAATREHVLHRANRPISDRLRNEQRQ